MQIKISTVVFDRVYMPKVYDVILHIHVLILVLAHVLIGNSGVPITQ